MIENFWANAAYSLVPTLLVGLIFWLVMRSIFRADRTERRVYSQIEAEERARFEADAAAALNGAVESGAALNGAALNGAAGNGAVESGAAKGAAESVAVAGSTTAASREPSA